jgi:hypothetical protein
MENSQNCSGVPQNRGLNKLGNNQKNKNSEEIKMEEEGER